MEVYMNSGQYNAILDRVENYYNRNIFCIPSYWNSEEKRLLPTCKWSNYFKDSRLDPEEIRSLFDEKRQSGPLYISHLIGKKFEVFMIDIDEKGLYEKFINKYQIPKTWTVNTKRGQHIYFQWDARLEGLTSGFHIDPAIEFKTNTQTPLPPFENDIKKYAWRRGHTPSKSKIAKAPSKLIEDILSKAKTKKTAIENKTAISSDNSIIEQVRKGKVFQGERNEIFFKAACEYSNKGYDKKDAFYLLNRRRIELVKSNNFSDEFSKKELKRVVKSAYSYKEENLEIEVPKEVLEINKNHAVVMFPPKVWILRDGNLSKNDDRAFELFYIADVRQAFRRKMIPNPKASTDGRYGKMVNAFDWWLNWPNARSYTSIIFDPTETCETSVYNTWKGLISTDGATSCKRFLKHVNKIVCNGNKDVYEWLIDWFADIVQNPGGEPKGTAVVLIGGFGSGKTLVGKYFGVIFDRHYRIIDHEDHLFGKFNYHLSYKVFVQIEEAVWGGDKKKTGKFKSLITSNVLPVEKKYGDNYTINSYLRMLITSNEKWVVPAGIQERRFLVLQTKDQYVKTDDEMHDSKCQEYFDELFKEMNSGGPEALLLYLKKRKIKSDLRFAPRTKALVEQQLRGIEPIYKWLHTRIFEDGTLIDPSKEWNFGNQYKPNKEMKNATKYIIERLQTAWVTDEVPYNIIYNDILEHSKKSKYGSEPPSQREFSQKLKEIFGIRSKRKKIKVNDYEMSGSKKRMFTLKFHSLEKCKRLFIEKTGIDPEKQD